jgi:hypothetical protein
MHKMPFSSLSWLPADVSYILAGTTEESTGSSKQLAFAVGGTRFLQLETRLVDAKKSTESLDTTLVSHTRPVTSYSSTIIH